MKANLATKSFQMGSKTWRCPVVFCHPQTNRDGKGPINLPYVSTKEHFGTDCKGPFFSHMTISSCSSTSLRHSSAKPQHPVAVCQKPERSALALSLPASTATFAAGNFTSDAPQNVAKVFQRAGLQIGTKLQESNTAPSFMASQIIATGPFNQLPCRMSTSCSPNINQKSCLPRNREVPLWDGLWGTSIPCGL